MNWQIFRWIWQLESPLYIGATPAGSVNRCRLYIPARAMWGAFTAEIARRRSMSFPDYGSVGSDIQSNIRFSYFYPAERTRDEWKTWLPLYKEGSGLVWQREGDNQTVDDRNFRIRLLSTHPSTSVDPISDTALEGSLHETEHINPYWRHSRVPVALVGYIFVRKDAIFEELQKHTTIAIGGDTRYGFGVLRRLAYHKDTLAFGCKVVLNQINPVVVSKRVLAHALVNKDELSGNCEILVQWDSGRLSPVNNASLFWQPGAYSDQDRNWQINESGYWSPM